MTSRVYRSLSFMYEYNMKGKLILSGEICFQDDLNILKAGSGKKHVDLKFYRSSW